MKPGLGMDEKSANVAVVMQPAQNEPVTSTKSNKRLLIGVVSGVILLMVVIAAVLAGVFLGAKVTKDSQKEAWLNYKDQDGEKESEHAVATDREEDYTVPNQMRVIYDFEKGYAVHKFEKSGNDEDGVNYNVCYVSHLNRTNLASPKEMKETMTSSEIDVPSTEGESEELKYESTGQEFDRDLLSTRAKEMCKDSKVVWMARQTGEQRAKRGCYLLRRCYYYLVRIGYSLYWYRRCRYYYIC